MLDLFNTYGLPALGALLVIFLSYIVSAWISRLDGHTAGKVDETLAIFFGEPFVGSSICAFIAVLGTFGISTASFAAVIAAVGFGLGLAMEGALSNVSAGIMLLIFRPFKVEDFIVVSGEEGSVVEIDLL